MEILEQLAVDSSRANIDYMIGMVLRGEATLECLFGYTHSLDYPLNVRSIRVSLAVIEADPELADPFIAGMVDALAQDNVCKSLKKELLKFFTLITIPEQFQAFLLDYSIDCAIRKKETKAARVYAIQVAYDIAQLQPELKPEILLVLQELSCSELPSVGGRAKRLAAKLHAQLRTRRRIIP